MKPRTHVLDLRLLAMEEINSSEQCYHLMRNRDVLAPSFLPSIEEVSLELIPVWLTPSPPHTKIRSTLYQNDEHGHSRPRLHLHSLYLEGQLR